MSEGPVCSEPNTANSTSLLSVTTFPPTTLDDVITPRDVITPSDVITPRDLTKLSAEYTIHCSSDTAELWLQHKRNMNFADSSDEDFLIFLLYQTVRSLSNNFSDTLTVPLPRARPKLSTALKTPAPLNTAPRAQSTDYVTRAQNTCQVTHHLTKQEQEHTALTHECKKCKKTFRNKYYLSRHEKRSCSKVNPLRVYHCQHCSAVLSSMTSLTSHMKQRHRDVRYSCDQCNKTFKNAEYVKQHVRVAHNNIKDHKCGECGKDFTQHGSLQLHIRMVHQKLRNYLCRLCQQRFGCKSHLTRHMRKQHRDVTQQVCEICDSVFQHESELQAHVKQMHYQTEFICNVCDKSFKLKHTLAKHIAKCHAVSEMCTELNIDEETNSTQPFT